jgi:CO dehydrogenase/acetyl-CoA synthase epsilon subunit
MDCCTRVTIEIYRVGFWLYKKLFPTDYTNIPTKISVSRLPWLFVGIELNDGDLLDRTSEATRLVEHGVLVTPYTLDSFVDRDTVKRYFYLDAITLKEEEIPAEGITINDS